jgi:hypothetical protein
MSLKAGMGAAMDDGLRGDAKGSDGRREAAGEV